MSKSWSLAKELLVNKNKGFCKQERNHHRNLCPKQFENIHTTMQTSMVAVEEQVMMQVVAMKLVNLLCESTKTTKLLLDCGSQRSYITQIVAER